MKRISFNLFLFFIAAHTNALNNQKDLPKILHLKFPKNPSGQHCSHQLRNLNSPGLSIGFSFEGLSNQKDNKAAFFASYTYQQDSTEAQIGIMVDKITSNLNKIRWHSTLQCTYKTNDIRYQTELLFDGNNVHPNFVAIPRRMNNSIASTKADSINLLTKNIFHISKTLKERLLDHPQQEAISQKQCQTDLQQTEEALKKAQALLKQKKTSLQKDKQ